MDTEYFFNNNCATPALLGFHLLFAFADWFQGSLVWGFLVGWLDFFYYYFQSYLEASEMLTANFTFEMGLKGIGS